MSDVLRIGIAGLGTVGAGLVSLIQTHSSLMRKRSGRDIQITCVSSQSKDKDRGVDLSAYRWIDDAVDLATQDDVDVVVELIGGEDGVALALAKAALGNGKSFVTANKAMLAHHGGVLAQLAESQDVSLSYEAAIAGAIPIVKALRQGFSGNKISSIDGILNGTCNYILSEMCESGRDFQAVLKDAQDMGYAEADPSFDVDGVDAAHKTSLLAALAFGVQPDFEAVHVRGIRDVLQTDIEFAAELGCRIKLLGSAIYKDGAVLQTVEPCLVPYENQIAGVEGVTNAVLVQGDFCGAHVLVGAGAGAEATASAVMSDIVDLARGVKLYPFGCAVENLSVSKALNRDDIVSHYYLRVNVSDEIGVMAALAGILRDQGVSIESLMQRGYGQDGVVPVMVHTHETSHEAMMTAVAMIADLDCTVQAPCVMRIVGEL